MEKGLHILEGFEIVLDLPPLRLELDVAIEVDLKQEVLVQVDVILLILYCGPSSAKVVLIISQQIQIKPLSGFYIINPRICLSVHMDIH